MAKILVNPASLKSSAKQISSVSTLIQKSGETAWRSASGAPSYDGQFGPKVRAIAQAALARAKKQSASAKTLSSSLTKRASAFEAADAAAVKGLLKKAGTFNIYDPMYLRILAKLLGLTIAQILILLKLGGLLLPIGLIPKLPWWFIPPWKPFLPLIPPKKPAPAPKPPVKPKPVPPVTPAPAKPKSFEKTAEKVPAGTMTAVNYRRGKSKNVKANCTWYAAHAVETASGGKIKIDSEGYPKLGNAGDWAKNCSTNPPPPGVTGVDKNATAGSVFCVSGHVGFVENVYVKDGETYITWSEEGWGRDSCPWSGGVRVDVGDDSVYRYRITKKLSDFTDYYEGKGKEIKYIHFNYENP